LSDVPDLEDVELVGCIEHRSSEPNSFVPLPASQVDEDAAPAMTLDFSQAVANELNSYDSVFRRKRKKCDPAQWKQNIRKRARQSGQEYVSSNNNQTIPRRNWLNLASMVIVHLLNYGDTDLLTESIMILLCG